MQNFDGVSCYIGKKSFRTAIALFDLFVKILEWKYITIVMSLYYNNNNIILAL
jgi:hypothetical protein